MNTEETKPHHSSVDTTTEKEPTAIVSKTEKQCISEGESKSIACKPSDDTDGPQDKCKSGPNPLRQHWVILKNHMFWFNE